MNRARIAILLLAGTVLWQAMPAPAAPRSTSAAARGARRAAQSFPAQSSVAARGAFGATPASSQGVRHALKATDLSAAEKLVGKSGGFVGTVAQVYSPSDHDIAILDFAKDYRSAITAIVKPANYAKLPNLARLVGNRVLVTGRFSAYAGRPQIEITSPGQVMIVR